MAKKKTKKKKKVVRKTTFAEEIRKQIEEKTRDSVGEFIKNMPQTIKSRMESAVANTLGFKGDSWGRSWEAETASLWVEDGNDRARAFYEKVGYRKTQDRSALPSDKGLWETRFEKSLGPVSD